MNETLATTLPTVGTPPKDVVHNLRRTAGNMLVCTARGCTFATMSDQDAVTHVVQAQWAEYRPTVRFVEAA